MKRIFSIKRGNPLNFLGPVLLVLIGVVGFYTIKRRGLLGLAGDLIGVDQSGASAGVETSESVLKSIEDKMKSLGISVRDQHKMVANELFSLFNEKHLNPLSFRFWSQNLYVDTQQRIVAKLLDYWSSNNAAHPDLKAIAVAYGVRVANNRQNALLGFLWDNTKGSLYDHMSWYMDDSLPVDNKYLGDTHAADIKRVLLMAMRNEF